MSTPETPRERLGRRALAIALYAAAHDVQPHDVSQSDGGVDDVQAILNDFLDAETADLAIAVGLPADAEEWQITDRLALLPPVSSSEDTPAPRPATAKPSAWPAPGDRVAWTVDTSALDVGIPTGSTGEVTAVHGRTVVVRWDHGGEDYVYARHIRPLSEVPAGGEPA